VWQVPLLQEQVAVLEDLLLSLQVVPGKLEVLEKGSAVNEAHGAIHIVVMLQDRVKFLSRWSLSR
jgi:hypothetical protein